MNASTCVRAAALIFVTSLALAGCNRGNSDAGGGSMGNSSSSSTPPAGPSSMSSAPGMADPSASAASR